LQLQGLPELVQNGSEVSESDVELEGDKDKYKVVKDDELDEVSRAEKQAVLNSLSPLTRWLMLIAESENSKAVPDLKTYMEEHTPAWLERNKDTLVDNLPITTEKLFVPYIQEHYTYSPFSDFFHEYSQLQIDGEGEEGEKIIPSPSIVIINIENVANPVIEFYFTEIEHAHLFQQSAISSNNGVNSNCILDGTKCSLSFAIAKAWFNSIEQSELFSKMEQDYRREIRGIVDRTNSAGMYRRTEATSTSTGNSFVSHSHRK
jgi:hypothetical protein